MTERCEKHGIDYEAKEQIMFGKQLHFGSCPVCEKEQLDHAEETQRKSDTQNRLERMKRSNIEPAYYSVTLNEFETPTDELAKAKKSVYDLIQKQTGKIIMLGLNGTGKTHLAVCAVKELGGRILTMYEISTRIRASYTQKATETELEIVDELASVPMLVIDELGRTKGSDSETNWLSYIIDKRHTRNLPLIIISNKHVRKMCQKNGCPDCLENYISEDIMSRLSDGGIRLQFSGEDYRRKKAV